MSLDKDVVTKLIAENGESASELLRHLAALLNISTACHQAFDNDRYQGYLKKAADQNILPQVTETILLYQKALEPVGKQFLNPGYKENNRLRPK